MINKNLFYYTITLTGLLSILHSTYSTFEHLSYLKIVKKQEESLPLEIILEAIFGMFITLFGILLSSETFKPALFSEALKTK